MSIPTSPTSPYPPNYYYTNNKVEFITAAQNSCGALEVNGLSGFGQQFPKANDMPQTNGMLNGFADPFEDQIPADINSATDLIDGLPDILSSLEVKDSDSSKKPSLSSLGGSSIWSDNVLYSPVLGNSNGSNNVSYGWGPPGSKVTSPQTWGEAQTMISTTFQDMTGAMVRGTQKP